jgi:lysophospholipase L1-like esterase
VLTPHGRLLNLSVNELRLGWALLLALGAAALLPDSPGLPLLIAWVVAALPGSLFLGRRASASRLSAAVSGLVDSPHARRLGLAVAALLVGLALVFSPSAALFVVTAFGSALLWSAHRLGSAGAERLLDQSAALGGALALVLLPLELLLRLPPLSREFGMPAERVFQEQRYDRLWERNVFRLRSPYERVARQPSVRRVLALGDSFTWGLYIADSDSTWPARLERRLEEPVEVINMAQRGWTTANEAEFLARLGWQFDPDLVIVQFYLNDANESRPNLGFEEGRRVHLLPEQFWRGYIRSSALSALASRGVNGLLFGMLLRQSENEGRYTDESVGWRQMRTGLRQIGDSARTRGTPVLFVLFPDLTPGEWTPATYPASSIHEQVAREAEAAGLQVYDLTEAFSAEGGDWQRWWATPYDSHPNEAAYEVVAGAIARQIERRNLLTARTPAAPTWKSPPPARSP